MPQNPNWCREELILATDLIARNGWRSGISEKDPRLLELSALLRAAPFHEGVERDDSFRGPGSVKFKYSNIYSQHPDYAGKQTNGGRGDKVVLDAFLADPDVMASEAAQLRTQILDGLGERVAAAASVDSVGRSDPAAERITIGSGGAGFGTAEHNRAVEAASMAIVIAHYEADGWDWDDVSAAKCGWDVTFRRGQQVAKAEVKGVSGPDPIVLLTPNEHRAAEAESNWTLAVVTLALSTKPQLRMYSTDEALAAASPFVFRVDLR